MAVDAHGGVRQFLQACANISARLNGVTTRVFVPIAYARECSVTPGSKAQSRAHYKKAQVRAAGRPALALAVMCAASVRICGMYRCACDKRYIDLCA